jgi:hypothetical protein
MSDPQQIERDLRDYLEKEPNLSRQDRLAYLQTIFNKHLEVTKLDHVVNYKDLFLIFADARRHIVASKYPVHVSSKLLDKSEAAHMAIMEGFILYLSRMKLLKKLVRFDYKD